MYGEEKKEIMYCPYCEKDTFHTFCGYNQERMLREFMFWYTKGFNEMLVNELWSCDECGHTILRETKEEE